MTFVLAQIIGGIAVLLTFISYQVKTQKQILLLQFLATLLMTIQYGLLGATTGMALNIVCLLRNIAFYLKHRKPFSHPAVPYIFSAITVIYGVFTWQGFHSLLPIIALAINTVMLSLDPQTLRKSILLTSPMILIYNLIVSSFGGALNEAVAVASSIIGLIRFHKKQKEEQPASAS